MANTFLTIQSGEKVRKTAIHESEGVASANQIISTNDEGVLDISMLPTGVGPNLVPAVASENLTAGSFVNYHPDNGVLKVRLADNGLNQPANGYVIEDADEDDNVSVYALDTINGKLTGLTPGGVYWLGEHGAVIAAPLSTTEPLNEGKVSQKLGTAISATQLATDDFGYIIL